MKLIEFHVVHDGLVVCPNPKGDFEIGELPDVMVDFVCHLMPSDRVNTYVSLILTAPALLKTCEALLQLLGDPVPFSENASMILQAKRTLAIAKGETDTYYEIAADVELPSHSGFMMIPLKD